MPSRAQSAVKRSRGRFEFALAPRSPGESREKWLRDTFRAAIQSGKIKPNQCLPSTRELARITGVSRGTVLLAIEGLRSEGYLKSVHGSGIFVADVLPDRYLKSLPVSEHSEPVDSANRLSNYGARLQPVSYYAKPRTTAFRTNLPALNLFPMDLWTRTATRRLSRISTTLLRGTDPQGYLPLRNTIRDYLTSSRSVVCDAEQILITSGIQESLDLATRILVNPGERVLIEDPGYGVAHAGFVAAGAEIVGVQVDREGAVPDESQWRGARLLYVTPGHQFPTGVTMSFRRREEILVSARRAGTYIFEDDYDSEYRYSGAPLPSLQSLDRSGRVIFAGSFNKTLFPGIRLGYVVVPKALAEVFRYCKAIHSHHHPALDQVVLCDFIDEGHFTRHLRRMRQVYHQRFQALAENIRTHLAGALELAEVEAGLQTVAWLRTSQDPEGIADQALRCNVDVVPLSRYSRGLPIAAGFQIGFAAVDENAIAKGVQVLAKIIR